MAPTTPIQADTPITVKITVGDENKFQKKTKIAYGALNAGFPALEQKLREFLDVPASTTCNFERFSDSAGKNIQLTHTNPAAYRQLLRAAKAKQKLKLRVTIGNAESSSSAQNDQNDTQSQATSTGPRPVTMEEVPEAASASSTSSPAASVPAPAPTPAAASTTQTPPEVSASASALSTKDKVKHAFAALAEFQEKPHQLTPEVVQRCIDAYPDIPGHFPQGQTESEWEKQTNERYQQTMRTMAQNQQDLADRSFAALEASLAQMNLTTRPAQTPQKAPLCAPSTFMRVPSSYMYTAPGASTEAAKPTPDNFYSWGVPDASSATLNAESSAQPSAGAFPIKQERPISFTVCCNSCERKIPDAHYHCSTCEAGDFDLCESCIELGITCHNPEHWMIRRNVQNGLLVNSTTERIRPKAKNTPAKSEKAAGKAPVQQTEKPAEKPAEKPVEKLPTMASAVKESKAIRAAVEDAARTQAYRKYQIRTCNNCIRELPEFEFLHCNECFDFDLCKSCFVKNDHGHHPKHAFKPAVSGTEFGWNVTRRLSAGRGYRHNAVCDGCEAFITGVRHKCSDCPDWDYCSNCILNADFIHPNHRFIPIYEPLVEPLMGKSGDEQVIHNGIYCDGPHCAVSGACESPIRGNRYKCAVCNNKDFCATCEASPSNTHNKTHPLIKFRTPVRHVSVTTTGEHDNGRRMPAMGDRRPRMFSRPTDNTNLSANKVQTVLDIKPTGDVTLIKEEKAKTEEVKEVKKEEATSQEPDAKLLGAMFKCETVQDGTAFQPNQAFEQTWTLRNTGSVAWPAGCCVRFVGGDYMGHVDPNNPAGIQELVSASESTICYKALAPGEEYPFTILLRAPSRLGKIISYWRLTTVGGTKFGDRLWCDITVKAKEEPKVEEKPKEAPTEAPKEEKTVEKKAEEKVADKVDTKSETSADSQMIFPKLERESPVASIHDVATEPAPAPAEEEDEFDFEGEEDWAVENSEDGFLTDEEYDILDASDEESLVGGEFDNKARK